MSSSLNIWHVFILAGTIQGFVLTFFLALDKKGNRKANKILSYLMFLLSIDLFITFLYLSNYINQFPYLLGIPETLFTIYGPLLFLYTKSLTNKQFTFKKKYFLFFVPTIIEILLWLPFIFKSSNEKLSDFKYDNLNNSFTEIQIIWLFEIIYNIVFVLLSRKLLKKHNQNVKNIWSNISQISFNWLKQLTKVNILLYIIQMFIILVSVYSLENLDTWFSVFYILVAILFYGMGYLGLAQPMIFSGGEIVNEGKKEEIVIKKYAKSALDAENADIYLKKLLELMEEQKPYLNGSLKLFDVATSLSITTNHLSQIINEKLEKNFFDFINHYRVEESKKMLVDPTKLNITLLAIALDSGFNSKSAFNTVFKKYVGTTPSKYQKKFI